MRVDDFDFVLPEERIALRPLSDRLSAKLLVVRPDGFVDKHVRDLTEYLRPGDLLVTNNTRVIPAFLTAARMPRAVGGATSPVNVDINLHKRIDLRTWLAFARPVKRLKVGDELYFGDDRTPSACVAEIRRDGEISLSFYRSGAELDSWIAQLGQMPLPPYIASRRSIDDHDASDYQTMFATVDGAVAAPTASLHFTPALVSALEAGGVRRAEVTLHVGAGTYLPVKVDDTEDHVMHAEWGEISAEVAAMVNETRMRGGRVVAAGTTSLRLLESAVNDRGEVAPYNGDTAIFITPGFQFGAVDILLTNFHLPRSTLFMLVSAFAGLKTMKAAYSHSIEAGYRFYSYGDACLLHRHDLVEKPG